ncbi:MAG: AmmeMemoRadiSam system protein A [Deltaproteobacteria bacterium]|nr:AmmeMemoRadiSam system protein A [Deltaproteobacteria bacterium]
MCKQRWMRHEALVVVVGVTLLVGCRKQPAPSRGNGVGRSRHGKEVHSMKIPTCDKNGDFLTVKEKVTLLTLARRSVEASVRSGGRLVESDLTKGLDITKTLKKPMGAFVTLNEHGRLRGCIGYLQPIAPLYQSVINNARNAALRDRRFHPVQPAELPELEIEVSALSVPVPVSGPKDIKIGCHGVILEKAGSRATYLPQVAPEQGWNVEQTLSHLSRKAGLDADAWRNGASFQVYTAIVFSEKDLGKHGGAH